MSCCWKPVATQMHVISDSPLPRVDGSGTIALASYPDSRQPHNGKHRNQVVYIVGWRTEHERLFPHSEAKAAVLYRNSIDPTLQLAPVQANQLCEAAIMDLYGP
jgi:hypothetical protein